MTFVCVFLWFGMCRVKFKSMFKDGDVCYMNGCNKVNKLSAAQFVWINCYSYHKKRREKGDS